MKLVFLDSATLGDLDLEILQCDFDTISYNLTHPSDVVFRIQDADIVITNKVYLGNDELSSAKNLKLICVAATGYNNIDINACKRLGIGVVNAVNYSTNGVVQHTFALAFGLINKMAFFNSYIMDGKYSLSPHFSCFDAQWEEISGKKWGIIGFGTIGKAVAKISSAFGCDVYYHSVSGTNQDASVPRLELDELLQSCDIISIHTPLSDLTKNLINEQKIALLKPNAIIINVARGGIVDEYAILNALSQNKIGGYACDVFAQEPIAKDNPLLTYTGQNLLLTPHIAWASKQSRQRLLSQIVSNIKAFLSGASLNRVV